MDGELDQLWYTWTTNGLDSGRGFQVRAASERFHDRRDRALSAALRYCYRPPGGRAYGWIEREGYRIVFNRVDAGRHSVSGGGNFFVHLVLGSREDLPASALWSLYDASFWQVSDPGGTDKMLPTLRANEVGPALTEYDGADELPGFLAFLLYCIERRSGMQVSLAPDVAAGLASAAAASLPGKFGLISYSTSESSSSAREYDVVCADTRLPSFRYYAGPDDAADLPTVAAAETLLDASAESRTLVEAIAGEPSQRREFVLNLITVVTYREGGEISTEKVIDLVSSRPEALNAMLDRKGMTRFADELARSDSTALTVLPRLDDNRQRAAAKKVAHAFAESPAGVLKLLRATRHSPTFTREAARTVVERAGDDGLLADLHSADRIGFIQLLADCGAQLTGLVRQLLTSDTRTAIEAANDGNLPVEWRVAAGWSARAAMTEGWLDRTLVEDHEFVRRYLKRHPDGLSATDMERIARSLEAESAMWWLQVVEWYVGASTTDKAWWNTIDRITNPDESLRRLHERSLMVRVLHSAVWEGRLRQGLVQLVRSTARSSGPCTIRPWGKVLDMLDRVRPRSPEVQAWLRILYLCEELRTRRRADGRSQHELAGRVLDLRGEERDAAALLALERTCYAASEPVTFGLAMHELRGALDWMDHVEWVRTVISTSARLPSGQHGDLASEIVGRWAVNCLRDLRYRPKRDPEMLADLETIAGRMSQKGQEDMRRLLGLRRRRGGRLRDHDRTQ